VKEVVIRPSRFQINQNAGFGFIELETEEEQQRLLKEMPDVIIKGRTCHCHPAHEAPVERKGFFYFFFYFCCKNESSSLIMVIYIYFINSLIKYNYFSQFFLDFEKLWGSENVRKV
jgi:RNA recognition motif-containing protein